MGYISSVVRLLHISERTAFYIKLRRELFFFSFESEIYLVLMACWVGLTVVGGCWFGWCFLVCVVRLKGRYENQTLGFIAEMVARTWRGMMGT